MAGMTLIYNGIAMVNVTTRRFDEEAVYDESGADVIYHKISYRCGGLVHLSPQTTGYLTGGDNSGVAISAVRIRQKLLEARQDLVVSMGGTSQKSKMFFATSAAIDVNNGPKPKVFSVTHVTPSLLRVEFEIETCLVDCSAVTSVDGIPDVLSNRWQMEDSYDGAMYCKRAYRGKLRTSKLSLNPQSFRDRCLPPLEYGFKRESMEFVTSVDGLTMDYSITDQEVYAAAPSPSRRWGGTHTISTSDGINAIGEVSIWLEGDRSVNKRDLIGAAAKITLGRLQIQGLLPEDGKYALVGASITDHLAENKIEMRAQVRNLSDLPVSFLGMKANIIGYPLQPHESADYNPNVSPVPKTYGNTTPTGMLICALQSPCTDSGHSLKAATGASSESTESAGTDFSTSVTTSEGTSPPYTSSTDNYSTATKTHLYTFYQVDVKYRTQTGLLQLPIADSIDSESEDTCVFIPIHRGVGQRIMRLHGERVGDWPAFPKAEDFTDGSLKYRLMGEIKIDPKAPKLTADGVTYLYVLDAEYTYGLNRPPRADESLRTASLPWDTSTLASNELPAGDSIEGIA